MSEVTRKAAGVIIIVATLTLLQSILYTILSTIAILIHQCKLNIAKNTFGVITYLIYFRDESCGDINWSKMDPNISEILQNEPLQMPDVTPVAERTFILSISYVTINSLMGLTSIIVLVSASVSSPGIHKSGCSFFKSWLFVILASCVLDVVATYFFVVDSINTKDPASVWKYLSIGNETPLEYIKTHFHSDFILPSVVFICLSTKLVVFWLINLCGGIIAWKCVARLKEQETRTYSQPLPNPQDQMEEMSYKPGRQLDTDFHGHIPHAHVKERRYFEPLKDDRPMNAYEPQLAYTGDGRNSRNHSNHISRQSSNASNLRTRKPETNVTHNQRQDNGNHSFKNAPKKHTGIQKTHSNNNQQQHHQNPPNSQIHHQQHQQISPAKSSEIARPHSTVPPEELRSQLPWSYFNSRDNFPKPKRTLAHTTPVPDESPPVPVPDYTIHFPRQDRVSIRESTNKNGNSSQNNGQKARW